MTTASDTSDPPGLRTLARGLALLAAAVTVHHPPAPALTAEQFRELFPALGDRAWLDTPASPPGAAPLTDALVAAGTALAALEPSRSAPDNRATSWWYASTTRTRYANGCGRPGSRRT